MPKAYSLSPRVLAAALLLGVDVLTVGVEHVLVASSELEADGSALGLLKDFLVVEGIGRVTHGDSLLSRIGIFAIRNRMEKQRDPKKIFVGMVLQESMKRKTALFWEELRSAEIPGFEFVTKRLGGYGLAKSRNALTYLALDTDCGRMVTLDSDNTPVIGDLLRLLSHEVDVVAAMYPKKTMERLEWVGNPVGGPPNDDGLAEALDVGCGFTAIDLGMIDRMVEAYPETAYECEDDPFRGEIMHDLWANGPVTDNWRGRTFSRYLTEDFYFCWRARKIGAKLWMDTRCQVGHEGPIDFLALHRKLDELKKNSIHAIPGIGG